MSSTLRRPCRHSVLRRGLGAILEFVNNTRDRAKLIKNAVKVNARRSAAELEKMLDTLKADYSKLQSYSQNLEKLVEWMKSPNYDPALEPPFKVGHLF